MNLQHRIYLLSKLGEYMLSDEKEWGEANAAAGQQNSWFIPQFVDVAARNIGEKYLNKQLLEDWAHKYSISSENQNPKTVGIVMAGNIPLVGFHDLLSVFITGNKARVKLSGKDSILTRHLIKKLSEWEPGVRTLVSLEEEQLKGCDAYIATGSNNTYKYFNYYFSKYPNIIRRNRTSVAILSGNESKTDLEKLSDDISLFFGLGCRNVTKIWVPEGYDFIPLLESLKKYSFLADHHKYKSNYDYNLALHILNKNFYMTNGFHILAESNSLFSPISQLHYEYYKDAGSALNGLDNSEDIQCICGGKSLPFGEAQSPALTDYADGVDTIAFLKSM